MSFICICIYVGVYLFLFSKKISHFAYHYETFTNKKNKKKIIICSNFQILNHPIEMSETLVDVELFDIDLV